MQLTMRRFTTENDYWRIREFLRRVFLANDLVEHSWQVYRFDYWCWHGILNMGDGSLENDVFLWENSDGELAAVLNREAPGSCWLQIDPQLRSAELESEMISVAEKHLSAPLDSGRRVRVWASEGDPLREPVLTDLGYAPGKAIEHMRRCDLATAQAEFGTPEGYSVRALGDEDELPERSHLSWLAFHPNEPFDDSLNGAWYRNVQRGPLYRRDLDLVAVAPDGSLAAFCTIWYDDVCRTAAYEPVGTAPEHQRKGLAQAVMSEGLRRARRLGASMAYVGSWNEATHRLYGSLGFTDCLIARGWDKRL